MTTESTSQRGRPFDPAVGDAALTAVLELLGQNSYEDLRMADIASHAGVGLGSLYRRWPSKRDLVLAAFQSIAAPPVDDDGIRDAPDQVLAVLREINSVIAGPDARTMLGLLVGTDRELASALRSVKLEPQLARLRTLLREALGEVEDLDARVELGPALITFRALVLGRAMSDRELSEQILPMVLGPA